MSTFRPFDGLRLKISNAGVLEAIVDQNGEAITGLVMPDGNILRADGGVVALSEISAVATLTATGTAQTGAGTYRGIKVRAIDGGPQTITVYDATSATGTPIDTIVVNALGTWLWDRPSDVLGGVGGRRPVTTGVHVVISGGTSRTVDVMVEAA